MGYSANSSGTVTVPRTALDQVWSDLLHAASQEQVDLAAASYAQPAHGVAGSIAATIAASIGNDNWGSGYMLVLDAESAHMSVYGAGPFDLAVLRTVAAAGGVGLIEAVGEDDSRWRWRLEHGGVTEDAARTVYDGDVDTDGWIAQLQHPDDHCLDHVAVVASESASWAQVAAWCRADYQALAAEIPDRGPRIEPSDDDRTVIALWTGALAGVHYRVCQVGNEQDAQAVRPQ